MTSAYINRIATAVPPHDIHRAFLNFARASLKLPRARLLFDRMVRKAQIEHRFSVLPPSCDGSALDALGVYRRGQFPTTAQRMQLYEKHAPRLLIDAVSRLSLAPDAQRIAHLIITSCTGIYAPGVALDVIQQVGLDPRVERTGVGFMGCHAAMASHSR